ncbi:MAG TPA: hypothetical protein VG992_02330 [Candidatus Saccharimonadales bacterium]|nr:hypothetical protein [Candidatus Saccharimonadales bacterium]
MSLETIDADFTTMCEALERGNTSLAEQIAQNDEAELKQLTLTEGGRLDPRLCGLVADLGYLATAANSAVNWYVPAQRAS